MALVVEDDPEILALVSVYCQRLGMRAHPAATASAARVFLESCTPDLVCLDLVLPESSGYAICESMRATPRLASVPVLVISGRTSPVDRAAAEEAGANEFLVKPLHWMSFQSAASQLLGCAELQAS